MTKSKGYEMELECPYCYHRWIESDPKKPVPSYIKFKCPKCKKAFEHAITIKKR